MHIAQFLFEYPEVSGPSEVVRGLTSALLRRGCAVTLLGCGKNVDARPPSPLPQPRVVIGKRSSRNPFSVPKVILDTLKSDRPDLLILHSMFSPMLSVLGREARALGIPYLVCPHNPYHPVLLKKHRLAKQVYAHLFERPLLRAALGIYLLSPEHESHLRKFGVDTPVIVLPNGLNPDAIPPIPRQQYDSKRPLRLLFLGRIDSHQKGLDILVAAVRNVSAIASVPALELRLVGPDWGSRQPLESLASQLCIRQLIEFPGSVNSAGKWQQLEWADLVVLPSRFEGFPMVIVEALAAGRPVLLSNETGISELVRENQFGYITRPTIDDVTANLVKAIEDRQSWALRGELGRSHVLRELTWDRIGDLAISEIRRLMDHRAAPGNQVGTRAQAFKHAAIRQVKSAAATTVGQSMRLTPGRRAVILCYHSVHPHKPFSTKPQDFAEQMRWIRAHCEIAPLERLPHLAALEKNAKPVVAITFDDGYDDNFDFALPILLEQSIPATFFITTGFVARDPSVLRRFALERNCPDEFVRPLTWGQIREMAALGMDIGAHTRRHLPLAHLEDSIALEEMRACRLELEDQIRRSVKSIAYPYGRLGQFVSTRTVELASESGYEFGVTTLERTLRARDSLLALPRFIADKTNNSILESRISGAWDIFGLLLEGRRGWRQPSPRPSEPHQRPLPAPVEPCQ